MGLSNELYDEEADTSFKPVSLRPSKDAWPTLVIEAADSQSLPEVQQEAKLWFEESGGKVKIVIIIQLISARTIRIERWHLIPAPRPYARARPAWIPGMVDAVTIRPNPAIPPTPASIVDNAPLVIEFEDVSL